jgi:hypothetical protein
MSREFFGDLGMRGRIILGWILKILSVKTWTGFIWLKMESSGRYL